MRNIKNLKRRFGAISASLLMLLGGAAMASTHVNADGNNNQHSIRVQNIIPGHVQDGHYEVIEPKQSARNADSKEEFQNVVKQANQLRDAIIVQHLSQNSKDDINSNNQQSLIINRSRIDQNNHDVHTNDVSYQQPNENHLIIVQNSGQMQSNHEPVQNTPNHAPAPISSRSVNHQSKLNSLKLRKDVQGLLNDLNWISNHPVDNQDLSFNDEMDHDSSLNVNDRKENTGRNK